MPVSDLRERNRRSAMRELQLQALELFGQHGFDGVTVEEVAKAGGVSSATVYRYFGTKEGLVAWDDGHESVAAELVRRLESQPPAEAVLDVHIAALSEGDADLLLRRLQLVSTNPRIRAVAMQDTVAMRVAVAEAFAAARGADLASLHDDVMAAACLGAVDAALDHWQRRSGAASIETLLRRAFDVLDQSQ